MNWDKDIRFPEKKVDASWKDQIQREQGKKAQEASSAGSEKAEKGQADRSRTSSQPFLNLISSLGVQALMQLGEMPAPDGSLSEPNLTAAREVIDILIALRDKTQGNLSQEEKQLFQSLLSELQLKFAQHV